MKRSIFALAGFALLAAAAPASAAPCAGFTDVQHDSGFCPNVEWLKNRAVTLGCSTVTLYCPDLLVNRLAMAAFMNRLGVALTPAILYHEASGATLDLDNPPQTVCATTALPPATYPRSAKAGALMTGKFTTAGALRLRLVMSTDNGVTWTPLNAHPASAGGPDRWVNASAWKTDVPLATGQSYRFGLRADRAGSGSGDVASWNCQLELVVASQTGVGSPF